MFFDKTQAHNRGRAAHIAIDHIPIALSYHTIKSRGVINCLTPIYNHQSS